MEHTQPKHQQDQTQRHTNTYKRNNTNAMTLFGTNCSEIGIRQQTGYRGNAAIFNARSLNEVTSCRNFPMSDFPGNYLRMPLCFKRSLSLQSLHRNILELSLCLGVCGDERVCPGLCHCECDCVWGCVCRHNYVHASRSEFYNCIGPHCSLSVARRMAALIIAALIGRDSRSGHCSTKKS